ncbi:MAG TPA: baseplate J/gp47 family protein, partial [Chloroflexota bacterium]|nr:baseplate J/gp47 family protein [Chloroflexota bacterium]
ELPVADPRLPPGTLPPPAGASKVFAVDAEAGTVRFGDGAHGARPPAGAALHVTYDYGVGAAGNVASGAIGVSPALPSGLRVTNPVRTWSGADAESVASAEREIPRVLQHRDRLVTTEDFASITWRTPGVSLGRVEVLPAFNPMLSAPAPGDAPGAITVMVIPASDPVPDQAFLDAVCDYLENRRLITTELFVRPPKYVDLFISIGIDVVPGASVVDVCAAVKQAILDDLSPYTWPLTRTVVGRELMAVVGRTAGVRLVRGEVLVGLREGLPGDVPMRGLELPRVAGISVTAGDPIALDQLRLSGTVVGAGGITPGTGGPAGTGAPGTGTGTGTGTGGRQLLPVPAIPAECR